MSRGFLPLLLFVTAAGIGALAFETEGFRVATVDGARQLDIERNPRPVPEVRLMDQSGQKFSFESYRGKPLFVDFIYTRCPTVCGLLGDEFHRVLEEWQHSNRDLQAGFLSVSFDLENDNQEALRLYGDRFDAQAPQWRIAVPSNGRELDALQQTFGLVVIPDGMGGFIHNSAIYLVDAHGRLVRALDPDSSPAVLARALKEASP